MKYNFDEMIDRTGTNAAKWEPETLVDMFGSADVLPFWIADMDFKAAEPIIKALEKRVQHGIYGYARRTDSYTDAIIYWTKKRFNWEIKKEWIEYTAGVVPAINYMLQAYCEEGDKIVIQEPVYYPFKKAINNNKLELLNNQLIFDNGKYTIDYDDLENKFKDPKTKLFILCNPHNPIGQIWREEDLIKIGDLAIKHNVYIIADEIHNDLVFQGIKHQMFASIKEEFAMNSITCTAPSKTFNLAGMQASNIIIPNPELMEKYREVIERHNVSGQNPLSIVALETAYNEGEDWLEQLLDYLDGNIDFILDYLSKHLPKAKMTRPEATYLGWIDLSEYESDGQRLEEVIIREGKVAFDGGTWFGESGSGFIRINFGCPRELLKMGLDRLVKGIEKL